MTKYAAKRILMAALTLLAIIFVLFVLIRIMPGDPFPRRREELGLNKPILIQFAD